MTGFKTNNDGKSSKLKAVTDAIWTHRGTKGRVITGLLGATALFMAWNAVTPDDAPYITEPPEHSQNGPQGTPEGPLSHLPDNYQPGPEAIADTYLELLYDKVTAQYLQQHPDRREAVAERRALLRRAIVAYEGLKIEPEDIAAEQYRQLQRMRQDHPGQSEKWYRDMLGPSYTLEITLRAMKFNEQNPDLRMTEKMAYELGIRRGDFSESAYPNIQFDQSGNIQSGGDAELTRRLDEMRQFATIISWLTDTREARQMGLRAYSIDRDEVLKQTNMRTLNGRQGALVIPGSQRTFG
jgi:hypothetical protein